MMEFVNGKEYPIYEMEIDKCLKPPTSICYITRVIANMELKSY